MATKPKIPLKQRIKRLFDFIKFIIRYGIVLGGLLLLDEAGGTKLILMVFIAYIIALYWNNKETVNEAILEILIRKFG